ncbi:efflux RND transporter periplasmic adaptor subunit [Gillisia sp. M10.2A]|uniref:Efflux RND transporter periplasmic adaptor subunit n=1 Tax=Gillisia lutea TaxID=2909668 RepID=A0ABS9EE52_9FLAO|nr:efflux RND transporter periplasmic adaptor subunit [Gillisia lutea]MCF4101157.1 efflux RND transporter periplasmic adaptor subunit [Gillisia lutea]
MSKDKNMYRYGYWVLLVLLMQSCNNEEERVQPMRTQITELVYSSVTIQPDSLYKVFASVNGILERNLVEEGDIVRKGDLLAQIINTNPQLNRENAKLALELAQTNYAGNAAILKGIQEEINAAKLQLKNDSINYFRQKNLWNQKIGSKIEYDSKKLKYELASNSLKLLQTKYEQTENSLLTELRRAQNNYNSSKVTTEDFTISSKINGKVYALNKNPGEIINTVEPLAAVGSANVFVIEMLVDEVDIVKIKVGQLVLITLDAYNTTLFNAKVSKIYPRKDERNQTFMVEGFFENGPEVLYPGMSGEANIVIAKKEEALTIPKQYLIDENKVRTENGIVEVEIGLQSMDTVEVLSGITAETWLYKPEE